VNLLTENLIVCALLALLCLWWFMRDWRATLLIASAIPVCLLATFGALDLVGRSLNVISLAGLAFAVGMVVDGAIVVSGNIITLKEAGMTPLEAAREGTAQVVPALVASTITTIAVFLPVLFLRDVEGQIFADLALTISIAVALSVIVAITKNFVLTLLVPFLLMAAMFRSLRDAFVVVMTVPVALVGGVLGLRAFQPLDLLTMIGFIMIVGVIVNHAILLVDRTRDAQNHGHDLEESIHQALNQRLRAILASTMTGALGVLPMALNPGPGSVIYRGLAAVNVSGVIVAMVFSLLLPSLMRLTTRKHVVADAAIGMDENIAMARAA